MRTLLLSVVLLLPTLPAAAQSAPVQPASTRDSGDAAHLFGYRAREGMRDEFDAGYRRHLQWHRTQRDALVWYGWYVADGPRAGMFVDGTFGAPFAAFDRRVDPKGDAADAATNVTPYADSVMRASYRLRREFSTGVPLEQWRPSSVVQVLHYRLRPGTQARFERALAALRERLRASPHALAHTWYEKVVGGPLPEFMLMVARGRWVDYDADAPGTPLALLRGDRTLQDLTASVESIESETWNYRADLSMIPDAEAAP